MKTELKYGMLHTVYTGDSIIEKIEVTKIDEDGEEYIEIEHIEKHGCIICSDEKCGRMINHNEACFVDVNNSDGNIYCDSCGKCIRFARKRDAVRKNREAKLNKN